MQHSGSEDSVVFIYWNPMAFKHIVFTFSVDTSINPFIDDILFLQNGWLVKDVQVSDMPQSGFEPAQNVRSSFAERSCAVVITRGFF